MDLREGPARDIAIAVLVVGGILLVLFLYTGNWPPPVVVESNSMMHVDSDEYASSRLAYQQNPDKDWGTSRADGVPFGRIGTIDPGDLVLVKQASSPDEVDTFADGGEIRYGRPGEVVVYFKGDGEIGTPIIHRAMTYIEVVKDGQGDVVRYEVRWSDEWDEPAECRTEDDRRICIFGDQGVEIPEIGWHTRRQFDWSGYVTQGDNVVGNSAPDQVMGIFPNLVKHEWVQGVARGELPWFGLIKLVFTGNPTSTDDVHGHPYYMTIGSMTAPRDLWIMLVVGLVVIGLAPMGVDYAIHRARTYMDAQRDPDEPHGSGEPGADGPGPSTGPGGPEDPGEPPPDAPDPPPDEGEIVLETEEEPAVSGVQGPEDPEHPDERKGGRIDIELE